MSEAEQKKEKEHKEEKSGASSDEDSEKKKKKKKKKGHNHNYSLLYFPIPGRAERIRLLFALLEKEFVEKNISFADWPAQKPDVPFGQLPVLQWDHEGVTHKLSNSVAIMWHLARENGKKFIGKKHSHDLVLSIANTAEDVFSTMVRHHFCKDEAQKTALGEAAQKATDAFLASIAKFPEEGEFLVGDHPTVADIIVYDLIVQVDPLYKTLATVEANATLKAWFAKFNELPQIVAYKAKKADAAPKEDAAKE